ncbi:MAG: 8-oxo-dGTP diphosphatase [Lachnospiraceae bacterium]|nr:8-oxo-dGTP diphosphatase [Lachnospiraceae bacterium]
MNQIFTTLCYIENEGKYLMLHRTKKEVDINKDKYIGVGGHVEQGEAPDECIFREVREETGLTMKNARLRGLITFVIDDLDEYTFLYTCDSFEGDMIECDEGDLVWVEKEKIFDLPLWEGDKIFFKLLDEREDVFELKLVYLNNVLTEAKLDGRKLM